MSGWTAGALAAWSVALAWFDLRFRRIPNLALLVIAAPALLSTLLLGHGLLGIGWQQGCAGLALGAAPLLAGHLAGRVGAGDVKLAALQGFLLGARWTLTALAVGGLVLGLMALGAWLDAGRKGRGTVLRLPAGPALAAGFVYVIATALALN